ncbi:MAG: alpha-ketoglutarate-dependent dioxygenase AlkB, partial [Armatimonadetes bacterium]|nr:alpha-ketoglutarate-dependent dioxygenase AlkB [Anaerolineae bacterium]
MLISGLTYTSNFLSLDEQTALLAQIDDMPWLNELKRRVQHYGYRYDYRSRTINEDMRLGALPGWLDTLTLHLYERGVTPERAEQVIVNEYAPGQGIGVHVDCEPCFGDVIVSLTLMSGCVMDFRHRHSSQHLPLWLAPGSMLVMQGE